MPRRIKNVIFSGGGLKGWAYIGAIRALNENIPFKQIEKIIGVSAGAVFGLFYLLQLDYKKLINYFLNMKKENMIDIDLDAFVVNESISHGIKFKETIQELLGIDKDITFKELYNKTGKIFITCAFNVTQSSLDYFNKDITPDLHVVDAIMASSALPILFPSYKIGNNYYYDGAICNNCPCNLVNKCESIAFSIGYTVENEYNIVNLIVSISKMLNNIMSQDKSFTYDILDIRYNNENINLNQSKETLFNIYRNGYKNTKRVLKRI